MDDLSAFETHFTAAETIVLEESAEVLNVEPIVTADPDGGFLIADLKEAQVRHYGLDGRLQAAWGARGAGPGEFQMPVRVRRTDAGELLVADAMDGRVSRFAGATRELASTLNVPVFPLLDVVPLRADRWLLAGRSPAQGPVPLLHLWNPAARSIERSFFPNPGTPAIQSMSNTFPTVSVAVRQGEIAAVATLVDTVFVFSEAGDLVDRVSMPISGFEHPTEVPAGFSSSEAQRRFLARITQIFDLHWMADGSWLVQYGHRDGAEITFNLLRMERDGTKRYEVRGTPRLLAVGAQGELYFQHPQAEVPNRWIRAIEK